MPNKSKRKSRKPRPSSKAAQLRVRMYRQGLGDCFLLTFNPGANEAHMLIDCGSLGANSTGVSLKEAVADILATTKQHLHLLVATHEHQDHVRGFRDHKTDFKKMTVDQVWLAWTENPKDELAQKLQKYQNDLGTSLSLAAGALRAAPPHDQQSIQLGAAAGDLLEFFGDEWALGAGKFASTVHEAMEFVRTELVSDPLYLKPGDGPFEESWMGGFRVFVLGPPRSESMLKQLGSHSSHELYHLAPGMVTALAIRSQTPGAIPYAEPAARMSPADKEACEREMPFDVQHRWPPDDPLMQELLKNYFAQEEEWRRIDYHWLYAAAELALQLDNLTNNTSLALAIERISDGKVLIFPADAQQGNWLSWHGPELKWIVKRPAGGIRSVTAADLLARAVFYKVGHHGSHNATARGKGLELMGTQEGLTAFVPVDRDVALKRNPKHSWQMPARALYKRLLELCQGRVVRSDIGWADDAALAANKKVEAQFNGLADAATWKRWRETQKRAEVQVTMDKLRVDYILT
jgi:hypothetical protein